MRLGVVFAPRFRRALVQLHIRAGSRFETPGTSGSTHLLEHVLFRGTENYPSRDDLEDAFHAHQVEANAFTGREWVSIHLSTPQEYVTAAVRLAFDLGFRPRFKDVEVERSIVDAEIREYQENEGVTFERIGRLLWGDHPLGFPVAGSRSPRTSPRGLRALHRRFFRPGNSFLMTAGNLCPASVQRTLRACLKDLDPGALRVPPPPPPRSGPLLRLGRDGGRGLRTVFHLQASKPLQDMDRLHMWVVGRLLEVRLGRIVREDRGACYDLYVDDEFGHRLDAISVNAMVRKAVGPMLVQEIFHQFNHILNGSGDARDLERIRRAMVRSYRILEDDIHDLTDFYTRQALLSPHRSPVRPAEAARIARSLTPDSVAEAARRILGPETLSLVLLGQFTPHERSLWKKRFSRWLGACP